MLADMHCHYPMHLLPDDQHPHRAMAGLLEDLADQVRSEAIGIAAHLFNDPSLTATWRVSLDGLHTGEVGLACSVLYWPAGEFRLGSAPPKNAFQDLQGLLQLVEDDLRTKDPTHAKHVVAGRDCCLVNDGRVNFVHCVEGGFNLGPDRHTIANNVKWLADRGILYITVAHLFFQGVSTNAPALPVFSDWTYNKLFHEPHGVGLTDLGRDLVRAMYENNVLVDISHMSERAIDDTFELIAELDDRHERAPTDYPVLATHVGMRCANRDTQLYNLTSTTVERIRAREGLIGVIMAQHQLGPTANAKESQATLARHLRAIDNAWGPGGLDHCAIGSDIDGFIKPTVYGLGTASDFREVAGWIDAEFTAAAAGRIRHENATALVKRVFDARWPGSCWSTG